MVDEDRADPGSAFHGLLQALRRRLWVIGLCVIVAAGAAYGLSKSQTKEYSATAQILLRPPTFQQQLAGGTTGPSQTGSGPAAQSGADPTAVKVASLPAVAARTAAQLGGGTTAGAVGGKVTVTGDPQASFAYFKATDTNPASAARLANVFATQYITYQRDQNRAEILQARDVLARQRQNLAPSPQRVQIDSEIANLTTLSALQTGDAALVAPATPSSTPTSPQTSKNVVLGAGIGLLIGLLLAYMFELLDRRMKDPKEVEELYARPTLGAIPSSPALAKVNFDAPDLKSRDRDAFRMLRANLRYFNVDRQIKSVLVTSAAGGEGKTTVAWNLAAAAAEGGARTLLLEADLRHPQLVSRFRVPADLGLSDVLTGQAQPGEVIHQVMVNSRTNGHAPMPLDVITAGSPAPNPTDLLESEAMRNLIAGAEKLYELVVIDPPPTSVVSDAIPLIKEVSGVIIVSRIGISNRDDAVHLRTQLQNLQAPVLGLVLNDLKDSGGYYGFGYGYAQPAPRARVARPAERPDPVTQ